MDKITLREVPYSGDENDEYYIDLPGIDRCFEIIINDTSLMGIVYISEDTATADGLKCPTYINWIEFVRAYRGKHLLRPTFDVLYEKFGDIYLEGSEEAAKCYEHIGCEFLGNDKWTGLPKFRYRSDAA